MNHPGTMTLHTTSDAYKYLHPDFHVSMAHCLRYGYEQYGEEGVKSILNFLYVWGIGDLTSFSNYAVVNEKIVFFDYSGFNN
jgi:hypothetical protein